MNAKEAFASIGFCETVVANITHSTCCSPSNFSFTLASLYCVAHHLKWVQSSQLSQELKWNDICSNHFTKSYIDVCIYAHACTMLQWSVKSIMLYIQEMISVQLFTVYNNCFIWYNVMHIVCTEQRLLTCTSNNGFLWLNR